MLKTFWFENKLDFEVKMQFPVLFMTQNSIQSNQYIISTQIQIKVILKILRRPENSTYTILYSFKNP